MKRWVKNFTNHLYTLGGLLYLFSVRLFTLPLVLVGHTLCFFLRLCELYFLLTTQCFVSNFTQITLSIVPSVNIWTLLYNFTIFVFSFISPNSSLILPSFLHTSSQLVKLLKLTLSSQPYKDLPLESLNSHFLPIPKRRREIKDGVGVGVKDHSLQP